MAQPTEPIVIVSGVPRSGTSMMMRALATGGMPVVTDDVRTADADNPNGYYECEAVKRLPREKEWLWEARGRAVKATYNFLKELPDEHEYRVLFMRRNMNEILASQSVMLQRRGEPSTPVDNRTLARLFQTQLSELFLWIEKQPHFEMLSVDYNGLVDDPQPAFEAVNQFLGGSLDVEAMVGVVNPALYRQRTTQPPVRLPKAA